MRTRLAFLIMLGLLASSSIARAAVPSEFTVQGVLRNGAGTLQSTPVDVSVSLFDASSTGTKLAGPFTTTNVAVTDGLFTLPITDANLPTELGSAAQVWIEVTIGTDVFPRQQLTSQLFALMCSTADVARSYSGNKLGVGLATPLFNLDVTSNDNTAAAFTSYNNDPENFPYLYLRRGRGTAAAPQVVATGDELGRIYFEGYNTGGFAKSSAMLMSLVDGAPTATSVPGNLIVFTSDDVSEKERMRITSAGLVGIGTVDPMNRLSVNGNADFGSTAKYGYAGSPSYGALTFPRAQIMFSNDHTQNQLYLLSNAHNTGSSTFAYRNTEKAAGIAIDNGTISLLTAPTGNAGDTFPINVRLIVANNGSVGIGTNAPSHLLHVNGDARNTTGVWATTSDQRLKRDIQAIEGALETVLGLRGVSFRWKDEAKDQKLGRVQGFIAQEVERVKPEWVKQGADGMKMIETIGMDALLVESIKAQQGQLKALRDENETLKARLARIEARLDGAPHDKRAAR